MSIIEPTDEQTSADARLDEGNDAESLPRPAVSMRFLLLAAAVLVCGYVGGPWLMTRIFRFQEESRVRQQIDAALQIEYDDSFSEGAAEPGLLSEEEEAE